VKPLFSALPVLLSICLAGCDTSLEPSYDHDLPDRDFRAYNWETSRYYSLRARNLANGKYCVVYGETGSTSVVSYPAAQALAREFDENIYTKITAAFGTPYDVDKNGGVLLLLLDIKDGYAGSGNPYTAGYFDANDMNDNSTSNKADMLYIDTYPAVIGNPQSYRTMAHELQHLISYSVRKIGKGQTPLDTWVDEGLSSAAEHIYRGVVQSDRIGWLTSKDNKSVLYGNNFFVWNGKWEGYGTPEEKTWMASKGYAEDPLTNYSTVYLFFQWLRVHAENGERIFKDIIDSPHGDYRAVTEAAALRIDSEYNDWTTLLGTWYAANLLQNRSGEYGYGNGLYFNPPYAAAGNQDYPGPQAALAPGEGIYSGLKTGDTFGGGVNIRYGVLAPGSNRQGGTAAFGASSFTQGNYLLTFNSNKDVTRSVYSNVTDGYKTEPGSVGTLPAGAVSGNVLSGTPERALTGEPKPELYQWDGIRYFRERDKNRDPRP
jgi:hypothetical protein